MYPKKTIWFLALLVVLLASTACSPLITADEPIQLEEGISTSADENAQVSGADKGESGEAEEAPAADTGGTAIVDLTIVNDLDVQICDVYVSPSTDEYWGDDVLDGVLDPGEEIVVPVEADTMDMMAVDCLENQVAMDIGEDVMTSMVWTLSASYLSAPLAEGEGDSTLLVRNTSQVDICWMYLSPSSSEMWGDDWMGGETLGAGSESVFYLNQGSYDFQMLDCNEDVVALEFGMDIRSGENVYAVQDVPGPNEDGDVGLLINNPTAIDVCWLYIWPTGTSVTGPNRLGEDILVAGAETRFNLPAGDWDAQAVDCQNRLMDQRSFRAIAGDELSWDISAPVEPGSAGDSSLQVINQSGIDICYLLISPNTASVWGEDWLGSQILPAGSDQTFTLDAGTWDVLALDCDQNVILEEYQVIVPDGGGAFTITAP